jgi:hypothetical protein
MTYYILALTDPEEDAEAIAELNQEITALEARIATLRARSEAEAMTHFMGQFRLAFHHFSDCVEHFWRDGEGATCVHDELRSRAPDSGGSKDRKSRLDTWNPSDWG